MQRIAGGRGARRLILTLEERIAVGKRRARTMLTLVPRTGGAPARAPVVVPTANAPDAGTPAAASRRRDEVVREGTLTSIERSRRPARSAFSCGCVW